jgi:flagellar biosynthesis protein FlhB
MAEENEQDRSEQPTPYKLSRSREKGMVARGMDLGFLTGLCAFLGFAWVLGPRLAEVVAGAGRGALAQGPGLSDDHNALLTASALLFAPVARQLVFLLATIFVIVLLFEIVQTGFVFSAQPLKPDFSRLNPVNGLKRIASLRLLIETFKNVLKLVVYTAIAFLIIRTAVRSAVPSVTDGALLSSAFQRIGLQLLAAFVLGAVLFAALDQLIARRQFLKKMRMSRREVRREARDREGEPRLKQRRKQLHREFAKASESLRNVRKADVVITNPDHIAIGLQYRPQTMAAPLIVSVGLNHLAMRLKRLAFLYGIPVFEDRTLARALFVRSALNRPIPEHCYQRVADIYIGLRRTAAEISADSQNAS